MKEIFKIFDVMKKNPLWAGISCDDFESLLRCIEGRVAAYEKDEIVLMSGETIDSVGAILSGSVKIIREDPNGDSTIIASLTKSELFGETLACAGIECSPVTIQAAERTEVLFVNYRKLITVCSTACPFHSKMIENMLRLIAQKNLLLNRKIDILSKRSIREKIFAFLESQSIGTKDVAIPYNREEMARYLCVDRSALSGELSKMRKEGLIKFRKNIFVIED